MAVSFWQSPDMSMPMRSNEIGYVVRTLLQHGYAPPELDHALVVPLLDELVLERILLKSKIIKFRKTS
jgi:hypothetical protein